MTPLELSIPPPLWSFLLYFPGSLIAEELVTPQLMFCIPDDGSLLTPLRPQIHATEHHLSVPKGQEEHTPQYELSAS